MNIAMDHNEVLVETDGGTATVSFVADTIDYHGPQVLYRFTCSLAGGSIVRTGLIGVHVNTVFHPHQAARKVLEHVLSHGIPADTDGRSGDRVPGRPRRPDEYSLSA